MSLGITKQELAFSYRYCRAVARRRARNFYYSFIVLPREKRDGMCAVYAFMRYCDDIADDPSVQGDKRRMLEKWRSSLDRAARGQYEDSEILPAFHDTVVKFGIPISYFHELIDGASMDLSTDRYESFDQLYDYCYKVASVVGLVCIHIFGFDSDEATRLAEYCGIAFQLTNILRDLKEDASMGRVYLPDEDLWAFGYSSEDLAQGVTDDRFQRLMLFEVDRARCYYNAAMPLLDMVHESGRPGLSAMIEIYSGLLEKIERRNYDVFANRVSLSAPKKLSIAAKTILKSKLNGGRPSLRASR